MMMMMVLVVVFDVYDYFESESIFSFFEKSVEGENLKFWDGIVSKKW